MKKRNSINVTSSPHSPPQKKPTNIKAKQKKKGNFKYSERKC